MDKRFASVIAAIVRQDSAVLDIEAQQRELYAKYGADHLLNAVEEVVLALLKVQHDDTCQEIQRQEQEFWSRVKPRMAFLHRRYITVDRHPERCVITKLEYCHHGEIFQVYYRTADGAGLRTKADPLYFRTQSFGEWAQ